MVWSDGAKQVNDTGNISAIFLLTEKSHPATLASETLENQIHSVTVST